jgi:hypothetical protein
MSILNNITPVNRPTLTNIAGVSNLVDVTKLPLYTEGNELKARELLVKLEEAKLERPKLIRSATPSNVVRSIPTISAMYTEATGNPLPANEITNIKEVVVDGKITPIQSISEAILSKFFVSGTNTKPEAALTYAAYLSNLASTLTEYAKELKITKDSFTALNQYNYSVVQELQDQYEDQFMTEEAFTANGSAWSTEHDRREKAALTDRMYASFAEFELYQKALATGEITPPKVKAKTAKQ